MRKTLLLSMTLLATGCSDESTDTVLTMEVAKQDFTIAVPAKGELKSATEVVINTPNSRSGSLTLSWIQEENKLVKAGEVIARFDGEQHLFNRQQADLELQKVSLSKGKTERTLDLDKFSIEQQSLLIDDEIAMTDRFSSEDLSIYSKNEVLDQLLKKDYLSAKDEYLDWSQGSKQEQGLAQIQVLSLQSKGHEDRIDVYNSALSKLEVKAPQDGIFIHQKNWRGEKVREGNTLWPGSKIGSLPSLDKMQAKLYVLETEGTGLKIGQQVQLVLDAYPDKPLSAKIASVASIATPKQRDNPIKYFEVIADIENSDPSYMKPGQKLTAKIILEQQEDVISVPNQVIYQEDGQSWVYVKRGGDFEKQMVSIGINSLTKSQLLSGVEAGDQIALVAPKLKDES